MSFPCTTLVLYNYIFCICTHIHDLNMYNVLICVQCDEGSDDIDTSLKKLKEEIRQLYDEQVCVGMCNVTVEYNELTCMV